MRSKSRTIIEFDPPRMVDGVEIIAQHPPVHPGAILREEFLEPFALSAGKLAKACNVPRTRIERIVREELGISADTALRLGRYFGISAEFWLNLQKRHEMQVAEMDVGVEVERIVPMGQAA
jgi:antitoxin HigA-1